MNLSGFIQYLQFEKRYSPHTIVAYQNDLKQFFSFLEKQYDLKDAVEIRHQHIRSWIVDVMNQKTIPRSVNRKLSTLKTYFKFLLKKKEIIKNPMQKVIAPRVSQRLPVFVEQENLKNLFSNIDFGAGFSGLRDRMMLEILYSTGMRRAELINLTNEKVDMRKCQFTVLGKGNKERIIPFEKNLRNLIELYNEEKLKAFETMDNNYLLVTDDGKKLYPELVYRTVKKYLTLITTVEKKSPHILRHSFATHLLNNGAEINAIKELLGHASLAATQVYTHNTIEKLKEIYKQAHPKA